MSNDNNANSRQTTVSYSSQIERFEEFLERFEKYDDHGSKQDVADRKSKIVDIELDDMQHYFGLDETLVKNVEQNTSRYLELLCTAVDRVMPPSKVTFDSEDILDVLWHYRQERHANAIANQNQAAAAQNNGGNQPQAPTQQQVENSYPQELRRRYELHVIPRRDTKDIALRQIRAQHIGKLLIVRGIVTRIAEVKPLISVATYTCQTCGLEIYQEVTSRTFMPLFICPSDVCKQNNSRSPLLMQTRGSKFVKFQEIKIQELSEQVPIGHVPRAMTVHVRGELTRQCAPGDIVTISGIFLPTPYSTGSRSRAAGLLADTFLEAMKVIKFKKSYSNYILTPELLEKVNELAEGPDAYGKLARSIAPEIYGSEDVKKSLLLMMVGGLNRELPDGMKIRGDINICLMGDPGVAKSQLLKHISTIAPRGIYTSGKGSSGVGLTAAVLRDPITNELVLEGGSLVLADKGICCIDEFDKMDDSDRTAIHEVMEQQTISIAKAGITTTLNARTAILAAANPAFGRYNLRRSPSENINLPAALLSRFDLLFLLLDKPDMENDLALAEHVTYVHRNGRNPALETEVLSPEFIRTYIAQARKCTPFVPKELTEYIVMAYSNLRHEESQAKEELTYTTARTLLAILRLSTALARIRFDTEVLQSDVDEAMRLMHISKASLYDDKKKKGGIDPVSAIYDIIRRLSEQLESANLRNPSLKVSDILPRVVARGYTQQQLDSCVREYADLNVWQYSENRAEIRFIS